MECVIEGVDGIFDFRFLEEVGESDRKLGGGEGGSLNSSVSVEHGEQTAAARNLKDL